MATAIRMAHATAIRFGERACRSASAIGSGRRASLTAAYDRAPDRLRRGPDAQGGAHWGASGRWPRERSCSLISASSSELNGSHKTPTSANPSRIS